MNYKKTQYIIGGIVFLIAALVYLLTMPPSITFWDSGELAASAYTLSIPHPPGAPLWLFIGRIVTMLPFGSNPSLKLNIFSALCSGVTVFLLFLIIASVIKKWRGFPEKRSDSYVEFGSAVIGALSFAFCDSFWAVSHITDLYAFSTMIIALCVWLFVKWWDNEFDDRILLLAAYITGLSIGVNFYVILILLAGGLLYYFKRYAYTRKGLLPASVFIIGFYLLINTVLVKWYPVWLGGSIGIFNIHDNIIITWLAVFLIPVIITGTIILNKYNKKILSLCATVILFIIAGYTIYAGVLLRAQVHNLPINENSPRNMSSLAHYVNDSQNNTSLYQRNNAADTLNRQVSNNNQSNFDILWKYKIRNQFTRYLEWQFIGRNENSTGVNWNKLYGIPFFIGLFGLFYHFKKNWKLALYFLLIFFLMGIYIALTQNIQETLPRERDYMFMVAFLVFSVWIGIGTIGLIDLAIEKIRSKILNRTLTALFLIGGFVFIPVNMLYRNYPLNDRHSNYVAHDFAYNLLQSTSKNSILFTDGDNDTYPLWYLQSIGYRTDVKVININLLNYPWYIKQLRNETHFGAEKININFKDEQTDKLVPVSWGDYRIVSVPVPQDFFPDSLKTANDISDKLTWKFPFTIESPDKKGIRVQDIMVYEIIKANAWKNPVYFSLNVRENDNIGLDQYLVYEGLAKRLVPFLQRNNKQFNVNEELISGNYLKSSFQISKLPQPGFLFRGLNNPATHLDQTENDYVQSYRSQYLMLAYSYLDRDSLKADEILNKMELNIPNKIIPMDYRMAYDAAMLYSRIGDQKGFVQLYPWVEKQALEVLNKNSGDYISYYNPYKILIDIYEANGDYRKALEILTKLDNITNGSPEIRAKMEVLERKTNNRIN